VLTAAAEKILAVSPPAGMTGDFAALQHHDPGQAAGIMNLHPTILAGIIPGGGELVLILAVVLLFFGGAKLPQLAKGLGQSIKEFKKASKEGDDDAPKSGGAAATAETKKADAAKAGHGAN
jgi:sec-independent protein translocase protein TatA